MEMFGYVKRDADIIVSFGYQYINARVHGYRNGEERKVFLGNVKNDCKMTIPASVLGNFDGLQFDEKKIELVEDK